MFPRSAFDTLMFFKVDRYVDDIINKAIESDIYRDENNEHGIGMIVITYHVWCTCACQDSKETKIIRKLGEVRGKFPRKNILATVRYTTGATTASLVSSNTAVSMNAARNPNKAWHPWKHAARAHKLPNKARLTLETDRVPPLPRWSI